MRRKMFESMELAKFWGSSPIEMFEGSLKSGFKILKMGIIGSRLTNEIDWASST